MVLQGLPLGAWGASGPRESVWHLRQQGVHGHLPAAPAPHTPLYPKALLSPCSFCPPAAQPAPILAQVDLYGGSVKIKPSLAGAPEATVTIPDIQACKAIVHVVDQVGRVGCHVGRGFGWG